MRWNEIKYGEWPEHGQKVVVQLENCFFLAYFNETDCKFIWSENPLVCWGGPKAPIRWKAMTYAAKPELQEASFLRAWQLLSSVTLRLFSFF